MYYKHLGDRLFNKFWINFRHKVYIVHNSNKYGGIIKLILFKRGISKIQLSLIFLSFLLITFTSAFADLSPKIDITKANMHVTSVTFNKLNISWYPVKVDLVDKVYNISVQNLDTKAVQRTLYAFYSNLTGGFSSI